VTSLTGIPAKGFATLMEKEYICNDLRRESLTNGRGECMEHSETKEGVVRVGEGTS
jgi:hypothetical protein